MNYGGIPIGTNMYTKPHKKKGFIGSLMSIGSNKLGKTNKYLGSYPSAYGVRKMGGGAVGGGFLGKHGSSAAMYSIFPYMAVKKLPKIHKPKFGFTPIYVPQNHYFHHHHHLGYNGKLNTKFEKYFNISNEDYVGKCQQPIKKSHSEITCNSTLDRIQCNTTCEEGYKFPYNVSLISTKCWHVIGVWRPKKNFPDCEAVCSEECKNGGKCVRPEVCQCPPEFRGDRCQFRKSNFLKCDVRSLLTKGENVGWACHHSKNETVCKINCKKPSQFKFLPAAEYRCTGDGVWKPDTLPRCVN